MLDATGCAGVSIGRGAFYNPWIFRHTQQYLETGELPPEPAISPSGCGVMNRHFDLMIEVFGEKLGCVMFRKVGPWYAKRFGPASFFNKGIVRISTRGDYEALLENYIAGGAVPRCGWRAPAAYAPGDMPLNFRMRRRSRRRRGARTFPCRRGRTSFGEGHWPHCVAVRPPGDGVGRGPFVGALKRPGQASCWTLSANRPRRKLRSPGGATGSRCVRFFDGLKANEPSGTRNGKEPALQMEITTD